MSGHSYSLSDLAKKVNGELVGDPDTSIRSISTIQNASSGCISFLANPKYKKFLSNTKASAVIVSPDHAPDLRCPGIIVDDPYAAYALLSSMFIAYTNPYDGMSVNFNVHKTSTLHESAIIGPNVYIGPNCIVGAGSIIHASCSLMMNVEIGENSIVHPNSVLGSDGFGYATDSSGYLKIEQLGKLIIGNLVEIGAGCTIDRGAIDNTIIESGVKIDNLVHIGHNCLIGSNSIISGMAGFAGSVKVGKNCMVGGGARLAPNIKIADNVIISPATIITKSLLKPGKRYTGFLPYKEHKDFLRFAVKLRKDKND